MVVFLGGAVTMGYLTAGVFFLRFWRRTRDPLFLHFAIAFWLFALNQVATSFLGVDDERVGFAYVLRVLGYLLILLAIVGKNVFPGWRRS
jgi:hypothetical protein